METSSSLFTLLVKEKQQRWVQHIANIYHHTLVWLFSLLFGRLITVFYHSTDDYIYPVGTKQKDRGTSTKETRELKKNIEKCDIPETKKRMLFGKSNENTRSAFPQMRSLEYFFHKRLIALWVVMAKWVWETLHAMSPHLPWRVTIYVSITRLCITRLWEVPPKTDTLALNQATHKFIQLWNSLWYINSP